MRVIQRVPGMVDRWRIHPDVAARYLILDELLRLRGQTAPKVISGGRTETEQRKLLANWMAGRPIYPEVGMPAVKPACRSRHLTTYFGVTAGSAIDVDRTTGNFEAFSRWWPAFPGSRWGGSFSNPDPNHFDVWLPGMREVSIC